MRKQWLLYDGGCAACIALAQEVEALSGGRLGVRSLREPEVQARRNPARLGWRWEPMLLEVEGEQVRVLAGLGMRARLVQVLGPVRALRVARLVARMGGPVLGVDWGRRDFLRRAIGALAGWIALRGLGRPVPVGIFGMTHGPLSGAEATAVPVGSEASSQGVVVVRQTRPCFSSSLISSLFPTAFLSPFGEAVGKRLKVCHAPKDRRCRVYSLIRGSYYEALAS